MIPDTFFECQIQYIENVKYCYKSDNYPPPLSKKVECE